MEVLDCYTTLALAKMYPALSNYMHGLLFQQMYYCLGQR